MRWAAIGLLFAVTGVGLFVYLSGILGGNDVVPVVVFSPGEYVAEEYGENPFGDLVRSSLGTDSVDRSFDAYSSPIKENCDLFASLASGDKWIEDLPKAIRAQSRILAGGPEGRFVVFYVSAIAYFEQNQLLVTSQNANPFAGAEESSRSSRIELGVLLDELVSSIERDAVAWVVLDLHRAPNSTNILDLVPAWETYGLEAVQSLETNLKERLVVTLPGRNFESNWLAPEYSSSFLGHFFRETLHGRFAQTNVVGHVTLGQLVDSLRIRVKDDVANARSAIQEPYTIAEDESLFGRQVLDVTGDASLPTPKEVDRQQDFARVQELWANDFIATSGRGKFKDAYRWDPIGFSYLEALQLALERAAINGSKAAYSRYEKSILRAQKMIMRPDVEHGVSLVEDFQRRRYFHGAESVAEELRAKARIRQMVGSNAIPAFASTSRPEGSSSGQVLPVSEDKSVAAFEVWNFFLASAETESQAVWNKAFAPEILKAALESIGEYEKPDWIETLLLKRMHKDLDWEAEKNDGRSEACANAIICIDLINDLTSTPDPMLSRWLAAELGTAFKPASPRSGIEQELLMPGIDNLLAGQFDSANKLLVGAKDGLKRLKVIVDSAEAVLKDSKEILQHAHHQIQWLAKDALHSGRDHSTDANCVGQLVNEAESVFRHLAQNEISEIARKADEVTHLREQCSRAFETFLQETSLTSTSVNSLSATTYRNEQIALESPLLSLDKRARLHANANRFLSREIQPDLKTSEQSLDGATAESDSRVNEVLDGFLAALPAEASWRSEWESILKGGLLLSDAAQNVVDRLTSFSSKEELLAMQGGVRHAALVEFEQRQRRLASTIGQSFSLVEDLAISRDIDNEVKLLTWPWSVARQSWQFADSIRVCGQKIRMAQAAWGDEDIDLLGESELFFVRSAANYSFGKEYLPPIDSEVERFAGLAENALQSRATTILRLEPKVETQVSGVFVDCRASARQLAFPESVGSIRLLKNNQVIKFEAPESKGISVGIGAQSRPVAFRVSNRYWSNDEAPLALLSFRGHYRSRALFGGGGNVGYETQVDRTPNGTARLKVLPAKLPEVEVMLLLDCSKSLDDVEIGDQKLADIVKSAGAELLEILEELDGKQAKIEARVFGFGLTKSTHPELVSESGFDQIFLTSSTAPENLYDVVESLETGGKTPLYNAVCLASEKSDREKQTVIFVVTDGVNNIGKITDGVTNLRPNRNFENADSKLKENQVEFRIVLLDYSKEQIKKEAGRIVAGFSENEMQDAIRTARERYSMTPAEYYEKAIKSEFQSGLDEFMKWGNRYSNSTDPTRISTFLSEAIPRATAMLNSEQEVKLLSETPSIGRGGVEFEVEATSSLLPVEGKVEVTGRSFRSASKTLDLYADDDIDLEYDPVGELRYRLAFEEERFRFRKRAVDRSGSKAGIYINATEIRPNVLSLEYQFWNGKRDRITKRPLFLCSEISHAGLREATGFETHILADFSIRARPYPEFNLPAVSRANERFDRLVIWYSDSVPKAVDSFAVKLGESPREWGFEGANLKAEHRGDRVVITTEYSQPSDKIRREDRVIVMCQDYLQASRSLQGAGSRPRETATFLLRDNATKVPFWVTTIGRLENAQEDELRRVAF